MPGPQGPKGDPGTPATVQIGTVTTLAPGSAATATNSGTDSAVILNLGIPQGTPGAGGTGSGDMLKATYDPDGDGKVVSAVNADAAPWTGISGKPNTFPSTIAGVTGLQAALDAKASAADLTTLAGRVTTLEGSSLNLEAVQDAVAQMFGTQGAYDDAAGTYTLNLPAGSSMTDEQVQDIVAALIQAGTNATVTYDDAANTLIISAAGSGGGGGGGGAVYLSSRGLTTTTNDLGTSAKTSYALDGAGIMTFRLRPATSGHLARLGFKADAPSGAEYPLKLTVTAVATGTVLYQGEVSVLGPTSPAWYEWPVALNVDGGADYDARVEVGAGYPAGAMQGYYGYPGPSFPYVLGDGWTVRSQTGGHGYGQGLRVATGVEVVKNVQGPLDPLDFPAVNAVSAIPNGGTARLKGSTPAKIFVRDSTGQLYEFAGTAVSG